MTITSLKISHHDRSVDAVLYLPDNAANVPAVLMSHGYNGCRTDFDDGARMLAENGVAALCYTFCGGSTRDESGFPTTDMTLFTEREDALALVDFLKAHPAVDGKKIFLFGGSMGGIVSVMAAQERPADAAGLVLLFPALGIPQNWTMRFPNEEDIPETLDFWGMLLGRGFFTSLRELDVYPGLASYEKPVLILQGDQDAIVSLQGSQRAAELFPQSELVVFPGEGHGFSPEGNRRVYELLLDFVKKH